MMAESESLASFEEHKLRQSTYARVIHISKILIIAGEYIILFGRLFI